MAGDEFILGDSNATCEEKICTRCKEIKPRSSFSKDRYVESGLKSACKICTGIDFKKWRSLNLDSARRSDRIGHYVRKYGLPKDQAESLADGNRLGICSICGDKANLVIDHCHKSGFFRGRICSACNSAIGYSKENIVTLKNIIKYLKRHSNE